MNERTIEILQPLLGADLARLVTGLVTLAETATHLGERVRDLEARPSIPTEAPQAPEGDDPHA